MLIPLYLLILVVGVIAMLKILAPELNLNLRLPDFKFLKIDLPQINFQALGLSRPKLIKDVSTAEIKIPVVPVVEATPSLDIPTPPVHVYEPIQQEPPKLDKLELLLIEKNNEIAALQEELQAIAGKHEGFDKVKIILEEEIARLRDQNRALKSELALQPPIQAVKTP